MSYLLRLLAVLPVLGLAYVILNTSSAQDLLISDAFARPLSNSDAAAVLTFENSGQPDRLLSVSSPDGQARLYSPADSAGVPIPTGPSSLALDAAHIILNDLPSTQDGALIPVALTFQEAGTVRTRLRVSAPAQTGDAAQHGLFGIGDICIVGRGEPAPGITLSVATTPTGYTVTVHTQDFTFSQDLAGLYHVPGMGHGHLYVGGAKIGRMYQATAAIGALPPGRHEVRVTLNTNDHRAYVVDDSPVTASAVIVVDEPA